jgi:flagellar basal body-associated protein FliL
MLRYVRLSVLAFLGFSCAVPLLWTNMAAAAEHAAARPAYIALGEFTINLPAKDEQLSYAVISITIEAVPEAATDLRAVEPRLKETVMRRLMAMADRGVLQPGHTDLTAIKQALISTLSELQPDMVKDVLIVRLLYG